MNYLGIDIETSVANMVLRALQKRKDVSYARHMGVYCQDNSIAMLYVDTDMTEAELDEWLYKRNLFGCNASVFERKAYLKKDGYLFDRIERVPCSEL